MAKGRYSLSLRRWRGRLTVALVVIAFFGYGVVLWRGHDANLQYNTKEVVIFLGDRRPGGLYRPKLHLRQEVTRHAAATDFVVGLGDVSHLLEPEYERSRQILLVFRGSGDDPALSGLTVSLNGKIVGRFPFRDQLNDVDSRRVISAPYRAYIINIARALSPPGDAWHIRFEDRGKLSPTIGGIVVIARAPLQPLRNKRLITKLRQAN